MKIESLIVAEAFGGDAKTVNTKNLYLGPVEWPGTETPLKIGFLVGAVVMENEKAAALHVRVIGKNGFESVVHFDDALPEEPWYPTVVLRRKNCQILFPETGLYWVQVWTREGKVGRGNGWPLRLQKL